MRNLVFLTSALCLLGIATLQCNKDNFPGTSIEKVKSELALIMPKDSYDSLNFESSYFSVTGDDIFFRAGFKGKKFEDKFALLRLDKHYKITGSRIVQIHGDIATGSYNGEITTTESDGTVVLDHARIVYGYIQRGGAGITLRDMIVPGADGKVLPEVIVVATVKKPNISLIAYYSLYGFMGGGASGNSSYYSSSKPSGSAGSAASATDNNGVVKNLPGAGKSGSSGSNVKATL